jgi:glycosyltransferase involved in cell wall biosynthesis
MRVMLAQSSSGLMMSSGGFKANVYLLQALKAQGHDVRMVGQFKRTDLENQQIYSGTSESTWVFQDGKIRVPRYKFEFCGIETVGCECGIVAQPLVSKNKEEQDARLRWLAQEENDCSSENERDEYLVFEALKAYLRLEIADFGPTHFLCNDGVRLQACDGVPNIIKVFICHAVEHLPFGPFAGVNGFGCGRSQAEVQRLKNVDAVFAVSKAVQKYIKKYGRIEATHVPNPVALYGPGPFLDLSENTDPERKYVVAINCGYCKGFDIFVGLAKKLADVPFVAVRSWSFNDTILSTLRSLPNVEVLDPFWDMDLLWKQTKILLVPSLWFEAFGLVVIEAMLRGIPVVASNVGGLPEAKLGVDCVVPVNPITELDAECQYKIPSQDITPWELALTKLLSDKEYYLQLAKQSRTAALNHLNLTDPHQHEKVLAELLRIKCEEQNFGMGSHAPRTKTNTLTIATAPQLPFSCTAKSLGMGLEWTKSSRMSSVLQHLVPCPHSFC